MGAGGSALRAGYPKLESSQVCSLGSLPPPGSTPPSFPAAAALGDLSQPHSPGNGDVGVRTGPTAGRRGRMNLGTPTLHPGEPPPTNTLVQPPSCILNPLQREKLSRLIQRQCWRALGSHRAVLSPWGVCPALRGSGSPWGQCCCPQPTRAPTAHLSPPPHGADGGGWVGTGPLLLYGAVPSPLSPAELCLSPCQSTPSPTWCR